MASQVLVEKLNDTNYMTWALKMKMVLIREECWNVVKTNEPDVAAADLERLNEKSLSLIVLSIENNQLVHVRECNTGREAWVALKNYHQQTTVSNKIRILKKLFCMQLDNGGSMKDHLREISENFDELNAMNAGLDEDICVSVILASLGEEYDGLVTAREAWDEARMTFVNVKAKLMEEWEKKKGREKEEIAMLTKEDIAMVTNQDDIPKCHSEFIQM